MRIAVIGASSGVGARVLADGVRRGHTMVGLSRRGTDLPGAESVRVDALDPVALAAALRPTPDAVVVTIGGARGSSRHRTRVTEAVLRELGPDFDGRVVVLSSLGVGDSAAFLPRGVRAVVRLALGAALADHAGQEAAVRRSGLAWTIVRPGGLTDSPASGRYRALEEPGPLQARIARADVAAFILDALARPETAGHAYALGQDPG